MKKSIITLLLIFISVLTISAQSKSKNKRVIYTTTPEMHCQSCEDKITGNLRFVKGVKIIQTNRSNQTVTITYDSTKCTTDALVAAFDKIKYSVKEVAPESLPSCCSGEMGKEKKECSEKAGEAHSECEKAGKDNSECEKKSENCHSESKENK